MVTCIVDPITQEHVDKVLATLKRVNHISSTVWLQLDEFAISHTNLTQLNLTSFAHVRLNKLSITENRGLSRVFVTPDISMVGPLIDSKKLFLNNQSLTDEGLGDILKYFTST